MNSEQRNHHPHTPAHKHFGKCLKTMRQKFQESLGETSGAVEIDVEQLDRFERGSELPTEDVLMLLISHFGLQDDEAVELWELAGYDVETGFSTDRNTGGHHHHGDDNQSKQTMLTGPIMLLAFDNRILYSSDVEVVADESGMVLNFMQNTQPGDTKDAKSSAKDATAQRYPVSRIGMTHEQTEKLIHNLQQALLRSKYNSGPKQLPPPQQQ